MPFDVNRTLFVSSGGVSGYSAWYLLIAAARPFSSFSSKTTLLFRSATIFFGPLYDVPIPSMEFLGLLRLIPEISAFRTFATFEMVYFVFVPVSTIPPIIHPPDLTFPLYKPRVSPTLSFSPVLHSSYPSSVQLPG
jgi:hypothetical protein